MTVRNFLDLSTAHLSPAAKSWLSNSATLNHASSCHGYGNGAAMGTVGATLTGWFMHAPELPDEGGMDYGMPEELFPIIRHARANGCHYILFDADADIIDALPVLDEDHPDWVAGIMDIDANPPSDSSGMDAGYREDHEALYPRRDWQFEVANGDTNLGYDDWLRQQIAIHSED